jgi:long-subunit acyl-CoA synthetase (AMP-forming)
MLPDDCLTFRRAVKKAFNIPSPTVTQQEVARVYVAVQYEIKRQLERRSIKQNYAISFSLSNPQQIVPQMV